ncbi:hypothetical protein D3C75_324040 [compost metagenome]
MTLHAEALVEEWLIRNGYFLMRGIKDKMNRLGFLAIRKNEEGFEHIHCEVQVSTKPTAYISKLSKEQMEKLGVKSKTSAKLRSSEQVKDSVKAWAQITFKSDKKTAIRNAILPEVSWEYWLVHGHVKDPNELLFMQKEGVKLIHIRDLVKELAGDHTLHHFSAASAGELIELVKLLDEQGSNLI